MRTAILVNDVSPEAVEEIDALGNLEPAVAQAKKLIAEFEARKKALVSKLSEGVPADQARVYQGDKHSLEVTEQCQKREITDVPKLVQYLGADLFLKLAKVPLTEIDKYLQPHQIEEVVSQGRTGHRTASLRQRS